MSGKATKVDLDKDTQVDVRCQIHQLSFGPHTDAKGIMDFVRFLFPKNVILVHGEKPNMEKLKGRIESEVGIQCFVPANNESVTVQTSDCIKINASRAFLRSCLTPDFDHLSATTRAIAMNGDDRELARPARQPRPQLVRYETCAEGVLVMDKTKKARIVLEDELLQMFHAEEHEVKFRYCSEVDRGILEEKEQAYESPPDWLLLLRLKLENMLNSLDIHMGPDHLSISSLTIRFCTDGLCPYREKDDVHPHSCQSPLFFCCGWSPGDEEMAQMIMENLA